MNFHVVRLVVAVILIVQLPERLWGQPYGLSNRVANTTLTLPPSPPAPPEYSYATEDAFGNLRFTNPLVITTPPGETNRLFVVEQNGIISVITNLAAPNRTVFMDISGPVQSGGEEGMLGLAFHPGYETNGYFFVFYTIYQNGTSSSRHDRLSRFETDPNNPNAGLPGSELILINQRDEASNHNGGDCHFGPDGYLYVSLGDEGGANDNWNNSQRIDKDFFAGIIRIDVDKRPESLAPNTNHVAVILNNEGTANYAIPPDNPWVDATSFNGVAVDPNQVRTEFYAVGLRNPWRISFDSETGRLYCGDVGQGAREEIDVITKKGNYGWAFREGFISGPKSTPAGATPIDPILDYPRSDGYSVTGGIVYRGNRIPQLHGHYIFADYGSGRIWSTFYDGNNATPKSLLANNSDIAAFGVDPTNGDVLLADLGLDRLRRLTIVTNVPPFPETLAATGAFADLETLTTHAGIIPYEVNLPAWHDHAISQRWFSIPNPVLRILYRSDSNWTFPDGSVWIQHLEMEMTNGVASSRRRLETRFLKRMAVAPFVYGVSYRWNEAQTEAVLVPEEGSEETLVIRDGTETRTQLWRYPARSECLACHRSSGGLALGMKTPQMNRDFDYNGIVDNQLRSFEHAGYFHVFTPLANRHLLRALVHLTNEAYSVESRVRSYLDANCAGCHQPEGSTPALFDSRIFTSLPDTEMIDGSLNNSAGDPDNRVVVRGDLGHSMLLNRIMRTGGGRMPPVGTQVPDEQAIALISQWITNRLPGYLTFPEWQVTHFGSTSAPEAQADFDADLDGNDNDLEHLTGTDPKLATDLWSNLHISLASDAVSLNYERVANRGFEVQWSDHVDTPIWTPLNIPANAPFFAATNGLTSVPDETTGAAQKIYRIRVFEP